MKTLMKTLLTATALLTLPSMAQAAIVARNVNIAVPNTLDGVYFNLVTTATGARMAGWDINPYAASGALQFFAPSGGNQGYVVNGSNVATLANGFMIGSGSSFSGAGVVSGVNFRTTGSNVFGFRFLNEATSAINYGFARISTTATRGFPATVTQLVYDSSGASLKVGHYGAGAVPEPSSWAMLLVGFGAVGFAARRRASTAAAARIA